MFSAFRFLNSQSVKALLRLNKIEEAKAVSLLFSKDMFSGDKSNLVGTEEQTMPFYKLDSFIHIFLKLK